jgi:hypothetical protein
MINFLSAQNLHSPGAWIFDAKATYNPWASSFLSCSWVRTPFNLRR